MESSEVLRNQPVIAMLRGAARRTGLWLRGKPLLPLIVILIMVLVALLAPLLTPYSPFSGEIEQKLLSPIWAGGSAEHILGTDFLGRDILTRLIYGARVSLSVSFIAIVISGFIGTTVGMLSGFLGGWVDAVLMRVTDAFLSFPFILLAMVIVISFGPGFGVIIITLAATQWARYARMIRGEALRVKNSDFVALARIAGCSTSRIILHHIFPNVTNTLIVVATLQVGLLILMEASLSFLGMGIPPPQPAWGSMVAEGRDYLTTYWWLSLLPGLCIVITCLSMNLVGDWLRDYLDPKRRQL